MRIPLHYKTCFECEYSISGNVIPSYGERRDMLIVECRKYGEITAIPDNCETYETYLRRERVKIKLPRLKKYLDKI